jgi:two-component system response regulator
MTDQIQPIEILLVEDSEDDAYFTKESFALSKVQNNLHVVVDGVEALRFLRNEGGYKKSPRPHLVLLDLNLPRKSGREVLEEIRGDPVLTDIPVIILTTSTDEQDELLCHKLRANCYLTKPVDVTKFLAIVKAIEGFCFRAGTAPMVSGN